MRALVVYESQWGNTEQVARAIAAELGTTMEVEVVDTDSAPASADGYDLLLVGGPTHAFSMSRPNTRQDAVNQHEAPRLPTRGIREWLDGLAPVTGVKAATFDTRANAPRLPGSAARAAKQELKSLGFEIVVKQMSFHVHGYAGPLVDGELERAVEWAHEVSSGLTSADTQ
ncbi:flavodoxin family protein [Cryobacterium sp. TMT1-21]|uniref:Flavodoxin family protein n=1 Tax=Cryobacterium shii TaxID=1259235 RepID=A0AAQ2C8A8_9MICO|nr:MULTISPECIES: flavodoxin domain-containing protein [Cryobacterium]TFC52142.1 flavodoxin family protein [Cryobacterium shii]TFD15731.1 flavodoxin family protein [Cryobacterium sp. TMT1-21]TFD26738.1 flavodoxin family protein [Cryobacterium sp. TMT2-23]TFD39351.1 flavodoxin family protein [Cryobacterium sp. TMT2-10]